jgi:hypothetical protein
MISEGFKKAIKMYINTIHLHIFIIIINNQDSFKQLLTTFFNIAYRTLDAWLS